MTDYAYKLVSLNMRDQVDWTSMKRARDKGWEPVPLDEMPDPVPNPLDMTPEQMANFKLCRMPKDKRDTIVAERETLNRGLNHKWTPHLLFMFKAAQEWPTIGTILQQRVVSDEGEELVPEERLTEDILAGAKLAYDWLHARGLA